MALAASDDERPGLEQLVVLRSLRLLKLTRLVRLFRFCRELYLLMQGVLNSLMTLLWSAILISVILLGCAIFATRTIGQADDWQDPEIAAKAVARFGSVATSMFS